MVAVLKKYLRIERKMLYEDITFSFTRDITFDGIIINIKTLFYNGEKLFELFCFKNDFVKYFAECRDLLFKCFVLHIMVIPQNNTFLYYKSNQNSLFA